MSERKSPLRAVKAGESPAPKKRAPAKRASRQRTMVHAAKLSRKTMLETLRDKLAAAIDDPRSHPRDQINAAKQLLDVQNQLDQLNPKKAAAASPRSAVADTPDESWNADAI
ncbi:terminase small subunit [Mycobacterium phage Cambiare]|uniref:Terminase small subunit n=1 Tax=Mycobacterium phage Cambiare TaxID=1647305 RepID=A0A0F6WE31_9CAUD|nr:terminase small subunit [Mycobacterium phage Cambiare]AKF14504.1 terminase small subunit [Mycobacterium phage Cambiare]